MQKRDKSFTKHLNMKKKVGYEVLIDLLLRLVIVVKEKTAKEMRGKKDSIPHDD
jgi:hypothetical protein